MLKRVTESSLLLLSLSNLFSHFAHSEKGTRNLCNQKKKKKNKEKGRVYFCQVVKRLNFLSGKAEQDDVIPPPAFHQLDTLNVYH